MSKLITFEGIDGSGKSTVIESLKQDNIFESVYYTTEPNENHWIGKITRKALKNEELTDISLFYLFMSEHSQHVENYIKPKLQEYDLIISDRYMDSRYAYQSYFLDGLLDNNSVSWMKNIQEIEWNIIPNKTIIIDISVEESLKRIKDNEVKEIFEKRDRLEHARNVYLDLAKQNTDRYVVIDGMKSKKEVKKDCIKEINKIL